MIEKIRRKLNKLNDHGSSFVLVIVSTTFLSILVSALMLGAMLAYKLRFYQLHSLNNFYKLEKSMDEIYTGVGSTVNDYLYKAYTTTSELVVVYDTTTQEYKNISNDDAKKLFESFFMQGITNDTTFRNLAATAIVMDSYISDSNGYLMFEGNPYTKVEGSALRLKKGASGAACGDVALSLDNLQIILEDKNKKTNRLYFDNKCQAKRDALGDFNPNAIERITFKNVCVKRKVELTSSEVGTASGVYEQSISTDIVLDKPDFNISFDMSNISTDNLYNYAILADMGIEVGNSSSTTGAVVNIRGNVYAASDYYNKDYNATAENKVTSAYNTAKTTKWGSTNDSANSGIFVNGEQSRLTMQSDVIVCSGALSAFNGSTVNVQGRSSLLSELWADNIIIDGSRGGTINAAANAYIYDDTELNAERSTLRFTKGRYFGYSYVADDIRSINFLRTKGWLASNYKLKSHFSDSAVIVNGKNSTLDFKNLDSLYIAGKSYIEFSKMAAATASEDSSITVDANADLAFTSLKDYSTGQSLDVKSNQLVFLTQWEPVPGSEVTDADTGITTVKLRFPATYLADATMESLYDDFLENTNQIKAIKQTVSGHDYYYLYIEAGDDDNDGIGNAEEFVEKYYEMFNQGYGEAITGKLYDVTKYEDFEVNLVLPGSNDDVDTSKINTSAALTYQKADDSLFYKSSIDTNLDVDQALKNASTSKAFSVLLGNKGAANNESTFNALKISSAKLALNPNLTDVTNRTAYTSEQSVSNFLTYMYINMKDHLAVTDKVDDSDNPVSAWDIAKYTSSGTSYNYTYNSNADMFSYDYSITPLHDCVDFNKIFTQHININEYIGTDANKNKIIVSEGNVTLSTSDADGALEGIIIAGGDVTFDNTVKSFKGLIITGAKLKCNYDIVLTADPTYVAGLLQSCAESTDVNVNKIVSEKILKKFKAVSDESTSTVDGVSISDISYQDILTFENWKKNVE